MTKTINLTGAEVAVTGLDGAHAHIRNDSADTIYAAKTAGITAGADGVASIPAGQADTLRGISGTIYLLGTGSALIQSDDYVESPFKSSAQSGGSGADDVARAAINTHAGNAEIHVTAAEKAGWNAKADLSDIPTTLPANGGNADTLNGLNIGYFYIHHGDVPDNDCDNARGMGTYNAVPETVNTPFSSYWHIIVEYATNGNWIKQTATQCDKTNPLTYYRVFINEGDWSNWAKVNDGGNADSSTYQRQAYLGSGIDILDYVINNVPDMSTYLCGVTNCPTCPTNYGYDADSNDFYYRISRYTPTYAVVKAYDISSNNEFMNTLSNGVWTGWIRCNDGGAAATADSAGTQSSTASNICLRNIYAGTDDMIAGTTALETGAIYIVYE